MVHLFPGNHYLIITEYPSTINQVVEQDREVEEWSVKIDPFYG
jgi:hypothetical protein